MSTLPQTARWDEETAEHNNEALHSARRNAHTDQLQTYLLGYLSGYVPTDVWDRALGYAIAFDERLV